MTAETFVIGVDYGTDSVRSVIVDTSNGNEVASSVFIIHAGEPASTAMLQRTSSGSTRSTILKGLKPP